MRDANKILLIAVLLAFSAVSCGKEPLPDGGTVSEIRIVPQINVQDATRAIVSGANFTNGLEVGYVVLGSAGSYLNSGLPHLDGYGNIRAQALVANNNLQWLYYVNYNQYLGSSLPGKASYGNVDIYGYYPYRTGVNESNMHAIPFSLGTAAAGELHTIPETVDTDYMYAVPELNYTMKAGQTVQMNFSHVMTCIEFCIRKRYAGPALTVDAIEYTITNRQFTISGTYSALDGTVTAADTVDRIFLDCTGSNKTIGNTSASSSAVISCPLIFPALEYTGAGDDAAISINIYFKGVEGSEFHNGGSTTYSFNLSDVVDSESKRGLRAGKHYQVNVYVGNFVKYVGLPTIVHPDWENNKEDTDPNII